MRKWSVMVMAAGLVVGAAACKKDEPKAEPAKAEPAKAEAPKADEAKPAEAAKGDEAKPAEPAKAEAPKPAGVTPEQIAELKAKAGSEKIDDKLVGLRLALSALKAAATDEKAETFKADQPGVAAANEAIGMISSMATNPTLADADKAKFKAEFVPALAEAARMGSGAVRTALANGPACTAIAGDPASLEAIDKALGESVVDQGWRDLFDCVMTRGPMEYARAVEKKTDYDRWSTIDRQVAVFAAQGSPAAHGYLLSHWVGFRGKSAKIGPAIVKVYANLPNNDKGTAHLVLTNQCDKDSGAKVVEELKKFPAGTPESSWAKGLETGLAACK